MMLASPLRPAPTAFSTQRSTDDSLQYRPSRDLEAFNSLLPPPVEFIEGSSSGTLAVPIGKYEPINTTPKASKSERRETPKTPPSTPVKPSDPPVTPSAAKGASLYPGGIDTTWPESCNRGNGLYNNGNTCFLNSALQCLLHTAPLLRILIAHRKDTCRVENGFCMVCGLRAVMVQSHGSSKTFSPSVITNKLQTIAKHMRRGRQEDSHEFLRYAIDALQKSCLAEHPPKIDPKLAETTWVHKIFGGQLRSRVTCNDCGHNSDTFDHILDLSLDIYKADALKDALRKFVAIDYLKGVDKYKCEKCKKHVVAEKRFTLHEAPVVLTVHLKRFSPLGKKIGHYVDYDDHLSLQPYMSQGCFGPSYSLYGVICHAGGGPNSGHYFAYVKSRDGRWWEMNDELVTTIGGPPVNKKNAYMLFYMRKKGQGLEAAVNPPTLRRTSTLLPLKPSLVAGMKGKARDGEQDEEDMGVKVLKPFIGPLLPSTSLNSDTADAQRPKLNQADPQAALVKSKIEAAAAAKARGALKSLEGYASDSDGEPGKSGTEEDNTADPEESSPPLKVPPSSSPPHKIPLSSSPSPIPPSSFYGTPSGKKRKSPDTGSDAYRHNARQRLPVPHSAFDKFGPAMNPYSRISSGKGKRKPRGL